jgi:ABC-2 type transport system ATP-binding protein
VQEVCDRVGILFQGRMRKEGRLEELIAIEDQTTLTLEGASPELLARLHQLVASEPDARIVAEGHPRTSLEHLFIQIAERSREASK